MSGKAVSLLKLLVIELVTKRKVFPSEGYFISDLVIKKIQTYKMSAVDKRSSFLSPQQYFKDYTLNKFTHNINKCNITYMFYLV
jgi:hypothetical protein